MIWWYLLVGFVIVGIPAIIDLFLNRPYVGWTDVVKFILTILLWPAFLLVCWLLVIRHFILER